MIRAMDPATLAVAQHSFELLKAGLGGNDQAVQAWFDTLAEDVILWLPVTPSTRSPYQGKAAVRELFLSLIVPMWRPHGLHLDEPRVFTDGARQVAFHVPDRGTRRDGSQYENTVVITLEIQDGKVSRFWEYWGGPGFFSA